MASIKSETQITWSTATSLSVALSATSTSDAFTYTAEDWDAVVQLSADNAGTPASGDTIDFFIAYTSGDILGDTGSDYDTTLSATWIARLDTFTEDPARVTVPINTAATGFRIIAKNNSAGRAAVVRARVVTHRVT